ncbi:hypothetical protein FB565_002446 [Actinoplanes lutulentus]|uniref:Uncharacterized protein n=1 Tax=Actinoplanes lutulentus TaxID=1287878 RepID=A0A327ZF11_9ACTN|nr:hypothetical protein [Actinoplanes lutulentus]MBB2942733.1 hypothetical protein [Actinoplanes lutulentus]RAK38314.1 hypothetical protein B0I29_105262 [Actinoplanes lutulentus]
MSDEQRLRDGLELIAVPPGRVQVETILPIARKKVFRRTAARATVGAALAVGVLVAVPSILLRPTAAKDPAPVMPADRVATSPVPVACRVAELPVPDGVEGVSASAVDPTGRYIVGNGTEGQDFRPVLWTDGRPQALPVNADSVQATAVNSAGVVVGLATRNNRDSVFRFENGQYTELDLPKGDWHPYPEPAINAAGDVVINAEPQGNIEGKGAIALLWPGGTTTPITLPLPKGGHVQEILDDGRVAGGIYVDGSGTEPWVWNQDGTGQKLAVPKGHKAVAYAISGDWVTGGIWEPGSVALWNLRTGKLTQVKGDQNVGFAVNAEGWVVDGEGRLLRDGKAADLPVTDKKQEALATDVSDTGLVVGQVIERRSDAEDKDLFEAGGTIPAEPQSPRTWQC